MDEVLSPRDRLFYNLITSKTKDAHTSSVLELGCDCGDFTNILKQEGYNAIGVDGNSGVISRGRERGLELYTGELTNLEEVFQDRKFDLIIARGVFCRVAQVDYIYGFKMGREVIAVLILHKDEAYKAAQEGINQILTSTFGQLSSGGYLIIREDVLGEDLVDFTPETAENIGYTVEKLERQEAILQKPLNK